MTRVAQVSLAYLRWKVFLMIDESNHNVTDIQQPRPWRTYLDWFGAATIILLGRLLFLLKSTTAISRGHGVGCGASGLLPTHGLCLPELSSQDTVAQAGQRLLAPGH